MEARNSDATNSTPCPESEKKADKSDKRTKGAKQTSGQSQRKKMFPITIKKETNKDEMETRPEKQRQKKKKTVRATKGSKREAKEGRTQVQIRKRRMEETSIGNTSENFRTKETTTNGHGQMT